MRNDLITYLKSKTKMFLLMNENLLNYLKCDMRKYQPCIPLQLCTFYDLKPPNVRGHHHLKCNFYFNLITISCPKSAPHNIGIIVHLQMHFRAKNLSKCGNKSFE